MTTNLLASLEYGVQFLGSPLILVVGHSNCGAVDAALKVVKTNAQLPGHLPELITAIKPAAIAASRMAPNDMPLLYVPYVPNRHEHFILRNRRILADQMEYLLAGVPRTSRLHSLKDAKDGARLLFT